MKLRAVQYTPILSPYGQLEGNLETVLELLKLSGKLSIEHPFLKNLQLTPTLKAIDLDGTLFSKPSKSDLRILNRGRYTREWLHLKITLNVIYGDQAHENFTKGVVPPFETEREYTLLAKSVVATSLQSFTEALVIVANLARPGMLEAGESRLFVNNIPFFGTTALPNSLTFAVEYAQKTAWPEIKNLDVAKTWQWAKHNNLFDSFGTTSVERAYNAFTYLFASPRADEVTSLFWALVGVEALYAKGTSGIQQQILEKTQVLLGRRESFKKHLSDMYQVRSRFVHGDLPFPGQFYRYDATPEFEGFMDRISQATELATAILISSLQMLVERNWGSLSFSYKLD